MGRILRSGLLQLCQSLVNGLYKIVLIISIAKLKTHFIIFHCEKTHNDTFLDKVVWFKDI